MRYRDGGASDAALLAAMNAELIADEGHRNDMTPPQLEHRMGDWLATSYEAVLAEDDRGWPPTRCSAENPIMSTCGSCL